MPHDTTRMFKNTLGYQPILETETFEDIELNNQQPKALVHVLPYSVLTLVLMLLSATLGFVTSTRLHCAYKMPSFSHAEVLKDDGLQPRVRLETIPRVFEHNNNFEHEPPTGPGSGNQSEPMWDSLIPKGLGYVSHPSISSISIPTVFHQLHCLYTLRRAYYATAEPNKDSTESPSNDDELQRWDLGKPRGIHVAHCFDFLQQGITCSADSTLEPAIDKEHGFLGTGFQRQCRDYEALKVFAEKHRVFEAEGFLADGIDIHGAHPSG